MTDWAETALGLLQPGAGDLVVAPPGEGPGHWAGAPSVVAEPGAGPSDTQFWLAYRLRHPVGEGRGYANVVAHSTDGVHFETVATVTSAQFNTASLERPALIRTESGGWRLYVSCSTRDSKHWWVEALDADTVAELPTGRATMVLTGDTARTAWKDIVVHRTDSAGWQMWACRHPLEDGDDEADRMITHYLTSSDGLSWDDHGPALSPRVGEWDARGARITSVVPGEHGWIAFYDGRATAAENWYERAGLAIGDEPDHFTAFAGPTPFGHTARYVSVATLPDGYRIYWEASRSDGANDLRTAYVPKPASPSQS